MTSRDSGETVFEMIHYRDRCYSCGKKGIALAQMLKDEEYSTLKAGQSYCTMCIEDRISKSCTKCPNKVCWFIEGMVFQAETLCTEHYYEEMSPGMVTITVDDLD